MNLLFISPYILVSNIGAGVGSRSHLYTIRQIVPEKDLTVVALYNDEDDNRDLEHIIKIKSFNSKIEKYINFLTLNGLCMNKKVRKKILGIIREKNIDIVFIDESTLGKLAKKIKKYDSSIKVVTFYHDIKANLCRQWIKENGLISAPYNVGLIYNEYLNFRYADKKIVLNKRDAKLYEYYYHKHPDGYLPFYTQKGVIPKDIVVNKRLGDMKLLFVGANYYPNVNGIKWFIDTIMPSLTNVVLYIVGKNMELLKNKLEKTNVKVIGTVDSLEKWYTGCDVVVSPIFTGGGMKTKTAEAFSYGKLFIGTPESYEGYDEIPEDYWNKFCWCCSDKRDFVTTIKQIQLKDKQNFYPEIYKIFADNYSDTASVTKMKKILEIE